jgi:hypothetical protein
MVTAPANKAVVHLLERFAAKLYKNFNDIELEKAAAASSSSSSNVREVDNHMFLMSSPLNKVVLVGVAEKIKEACEHEPNTGNSIFIFGINFIISLIEQLLIPISIYMMCLYGCTF